MSTTSLPEISGHPTLSVEDALIDRRSVRAYLPTPVPVEQIQQILSLAARSASNSNSQPWHAHVVAGAAKDALTAAMLDAIGTGQRRSEKDLEYDYQPEAGSWPEPFLSRRQRFGRRLYGGALNIATDDDRRRWLYHLRNYAFFGAPVGIVLTVHRSLRSGALVDAGLFLQALMLAARSRGLDTCPQASLIHLYPVLRRQLDIPADRLVVCGIALGFADHSSPLAAQLTDREPVEAFTTFHGFPDPTEHHQ